MRIHVCGPGVVGKATGEGFRRFGHEVVYTDQGESHELVKADVHFICTPEAAAPGVARQMRGADGLLVIRSSVPPGTCDSLSKELRRYVVHNPEFLKEVTAEADFLNAAAALVGLPEQLAEPLFSTPEISPILNSTHLCELYEGIGKQVVICYSTESEMLKLLLNAHLASLVSWWNEAEQLCLAVGVNSHRVANLMVSMDPRVSAYGALRHGQPYGGRCLPKDVSQLLALARKTRTVTSILTAVDATNKLVATRREAA